MHTFSDRLLSAAHRVGRRMAPRFVCVAAAMVIAGCQAAPRNYAAIRAYYDYDFASATAMLRNEADVVDEQYVLNNARLGLAALAAGEAPQAERALGRVFDMLSTAGLNEDRTVAAVLTWEGVRIWKGEPFEQALMYASIASLYATMNDWENVRAAAANALFRLRDFGEQHSDESLAREAVRDEDYLNEGYAAVDTNFALGFVLQAIGTQLSGLGGAEAQFDAARRIAPQLSTMIDTLQGGDYDTLLIVDYGKGPTKRAYGPDNAFAEFQPQEAPHGPLVVRAVSEASFGHAPRTFADVCDVDTLAVDHRWNNLEDVRHAKSVLGDGLLLSGLVVASSGGHRHDSDQLLIGAGLALAGLLSKSGAQADTRYLEFVPQAVYVAPLLLDGNTTLDVSIQGEPAARVVLPDVEPGGLVRDSGQPRVIYLRLHGGDSPAPTWLTTPVISTPAVDVQPYSIGWKRRATHTAETAQGEVR